MEAEYNILTRNNPEQKSKTRCRKQIRIQQDQKIYEKSLESESQGKDPKPIRKTASIKHLHQSGLVNSK